MHAWPGQDCLDHSPATGRSFPRPPGGLPLCMRHEYDGARLPGAQERPAPRPPPLPPVAECRRPSASRALALSLNRASFGLSRCETFTVALARGWRVRPLRLQVRAVPAARLRRDEKLRARSCHALNNLSRTSPNCPCNKPHAKAIIRQEDNKIRSYPW